MHIQSTPIVLFLISLTLACDTSYTLEHTVNPCIFYMQPNDAACTTFIFDQCIYDKVCLKYKEKTNSRECIQRGYLYGNSWEFCTNKCCDDSVSYAQNYEGIKQCQNYLNQKSKNNLKIFLGIFFGCYAFLNISAVIFFFCCPFQQILNKPIPPLAENSLQNIREAAYHEENWKFENLEDQKLNNICSICLDRDPSLQLQCSHIYHRKCFIEWFNRKNDCPSCRSVKINQMKIYCQRCFKSYFEVNLILKQQNLKSNAQICPNCIDVNS